MVIFQYMVLSLDEIYQILLKILNVLIFSTIPHWNNQSIPKILFHYSIPIWLHLLLMIILLTTSLNTFPISLNCNLKYQFIFEFDSSHLIFIIPKYSIIQLPSYSNYKLIVFPSIFLRNLITCTRFHYKILNFLDTF